jgi:hypothetical protein
MLLTAAYCLFRLAISRLRHRQADHDIDATHTVMAVSMAGMLTAGLRFLPNGVWAVFFAIAAAWFGWKVVRDQATAKAVSGQQAVRAHRGHDVPILLMCGAMVYMLLAGTAMGSRASGAGMDMGGSGGTHFTVLAFALTLALFGYAIWAIDHFPALATVSALRAAEPLPALALAGGGGTTAVAIGSRPDTTTDLAATSAEVTAANPPLSPRLAACCSIAMALVMAYMLVLML